MGLPPAFSILEYISTKRIPADAEGGCADGDISK